MTQPDGADTLAERVTEALRQADDHSCMYQEGADYAALTAAVLAAVQPEMERLRKAERAVNLLADAHRRAEQVEELLAIAHETSNTSEAERARAVKRAEEAEAALARVREYATAWAALQPADLVLADAGRCLLAVTQPPPPTPVASPASD